MSRFIFRSGACGLIAAAWLQAAGEAPAQDLPDRVRAAVASARLGAGYAQMVSLSATPDVSAANYRIDSFDPAANLDVLRLPYEAKWVALSPDADLHWKVAAGWMRLEQDFHYDLAAAPGGSIGSRWSAYSAGGGLVLKYRLPGGFTLEPALDVALGRLENDASYAGSATALQPLLRGLLFDWSAGTWLVTPSVALAWNGAAGDGNVAVRAHVARSWIGSFDETDAIQHFHDTANAWSLRAEYAAPSPWRAFERPVGWVAFAGCAGFFGANRKALGFDTAAEVGTGLELPLAAGMPRGDRLRLAASYLAGPDVRGWTIGVGLAY